VRNIFGREIFADLDLGTLLPTRDYSKQPFHLSDHQRVSEFYRVSVDNLAPTKATFDEMATNVKFPDEKIGILPWVPDNTTRNLGGFLAQWHKNKEPIYFSMNIIMSRIRAEFDERYRKYLETPNVQTDLEVFYKGKLIYHRERSFKSMPLAKADAQEVMKRLDAMTIPEFLAMAKPFMGKLSADQEGEYDIHEPVSIMDVKPQNAYLGELLLTTVFVKLAGSTENYLQSLGVQPDVIQFVSGQPPEVAKRLVNELRKNNQATMQQLQEMAQGLAKKQKYEPTRRELSLAGRFEHVPGMPQWILLQTKKYRAKKNMIRNPTPSNFPDHEFDYNWPEGVTALAITGPQSLQAMGRVFSEIGDWAGAMGIQLASYDLPTAKAESDKWHAEQAAQTGEGYQEKNVVFTLKNGWTIQKVQTENDLKVEGNLMGHCVGSYCESVYSGASEIYSLRDPQNTPHATIEVEGGERDTNYEPPRPRQRRKNDRWNVVQIQGKQNQEPIPEYKAMIKEWFENIGPQNIEMATENRDLDDVIYNEDVDSYAEAIETWRGGMENDYGIPQMLGIENLRGGELWNAYHLIETNYAKTYGRREMEYIPQVMRSTAYALADLAWDAAMQAGKSDWSMASTTFAMTGVEKIMDEHREKFDNDVMGGDTGLRVEQFESEEAFYEAEQKIHDEWYRTWLPGGMDMAILERWQQRRQETGGLWPTEMLMNVTEGKDMMTPRQKAV